MVILRCLIRHSQTGIVPDEVSGAEGVSVAPGEIDDGAESLDQASISLEEAISAAQETTSGDLGEIDLEMYQRVLVFNVDIGIQDVKVDASDGAELGQVSEAK